jgi:hypothetical protein
MRRAAMANARAPATLMPAIMPVLRWEFEGWSRVGEGEVVGRGILGEVEAGDAVKNGEASDALESGASVATVVFAGVPVGVNGILSLDASTDA